MPSLLPVSTDGTTIAKKKWTGFIDSGSTQDVLVIKGQGGDITIEWNAGDLQLKVLNTSIYSLTNCSFTHKKVIDNITADVTLDSGSDPATITAATGTFFFTDLGTVADAVKLNSVQDRSTISKFVFTETGFNSYIVNLDVVRLPNDKISVEVNYQVTT